MSKRERRPHLRAQLRVEQLEERNLLNGTALPNATPADLLVRYRGTEQENWQAVPLPTGLSLAQALAQYRKSFEQFCDSFVARESPHKTNYRGGGGNSKV